MRRPERRPPHHCSYAIARHGLYRTYNTRHTHSSLIVTSTCIRTSSLTALIPYNQSAFTNNITHSPATTMFSQTIVSTAITSTSENMNLVSSTAKTTSYPKTKPITNNGTTTGEHALIYVYVCVCVCVCVCTSASIHV